jgi:hypothetical protein
VGARFGRRARAARPGDGGGREAGEVAGLGVHRGDGLSVETVAVDQRCGVWDS